MRAGAESARDSYLELIKLQERWFAGAKLGLNGMKAQLQAIIHSYGQQIDGQTTGLMKQWTTAVEKCLDSYSSQVGHISGGLADLQDEISKLPR